MGLVYTTMRVPLTARVRCGVLLRRCFLWVVSIWQCGFLSQRGCVVVCYLGYDSCGSCLYGNAGSSHSAGVLWCVI